MLRRSQKVIDQEKAAIDHFLKNSNDEMKIEREWLMQNFEEKFKNNEEYKRRAKAFNAYCKENVLDIHF